MLGTLFPDRYGVSKEGFVYSSLPMRIESDADRQLLIEAIERFQDRVCGFRWPDGRVDPGRRTITKLREIAFVRGRVMPVDTATALRQAATSSPYVLRTGRWRLQATYRPGEVYAGLDGRRLLLAIDGHRAIFQLLDDAGPGRAIFNPLRGRPGRIYKQSTAEFLNEWDAVFYHRMAERLKSLKVVMKMEIKFMIACSSALSGGVGAILFGTSLFKFLNDNRSEIRTWVAAVDAFVDGRRTLQRFTPTLYDKFEQLLLHNVRRAAATVVDEKGRDVLAHVDDTMAGDPGAAAKLVGALVGTIGKAAFKGRMASLGGIAGDVLKLIGKRAGLALPGAAAKTFQNMSDQEKASLAVRLIRRFEASGVKVSRSEALVIVAELSREEHRHEVRRALERLYRACRAVKPPRTGWGLVP
ncbi:MAG: hypothetical protein GVY33_11065 [Alphaproteobacteria bacterium]|nr:hypothetical protein [Alphaproteobacteria bacterium]